MKGWREGYPCPTSCTCRTLLVRVLRPEFCEALVKCGADLRLLPGGETFVPRVAVPSPMQCLVAFASDLRRCVRHCAARRRSRFTAALRWPAARCGPNESCFLKQRRRDCSSRYSLPCAGAAVPLRMIPMKQVAIVALLVALPIGTAWGEIYSWRDEAGVRHFTNVREEIPPAYRERAEVAVSSVWLPKVESAPTSCEPEEPGRQAQVVVVPGARARERIRPQPAEPMVVQGGSVNIEGPLAVAVGPPPVNWPVWGALPLITTAFDRGRSRHLTLRQLAEEQRWLQETLGWSPGLLELVPFAGGPRPPCVAWRTCPVR